MDNPARKKPRAPSMVPSSHATFCFAEGVWSEIGSAYSRRLLRMRKDGDYSGIANMPMPDPLRYNCPRGFGRDYLAWSLLRKADFLPLGVDRSAVAIDNFLKTEVSCARFNALHGFDPTSSLTPGNPWLTPSAVIQRARAKIQKLVGQFSWNDVERHFGFSSGSSTRLKRASGDAYYKYQGSPHVTPHAQLPALLALDRQAQWSKNHDRWAFESWLTLVAGSKAFTVPKNAKTDRFCAAEPDMNMYLQRGIGGRLRYLLKKVRVDLDDQSWNQYLARVGSALGSLATIDLAAASDSISVELVRLLLPSDWFDALMCLRSPYTRLPSGEWHRMEKISSMGNGYTFELESLIFWAITSSSVDAYLDAYAGDTEYQQLRAINTQIAIYGDDIVVDSRVAPVVIDALASVGFATNVEKTFVAGPFRESCGKHYFRGVDVTPFNITRVVDVASRVNWLANSYNAWLLRLSIKADPRWLRPLDNWATHVYAPVPNWESDEGGLRVSHTAAHWYTLGGSQGYLFKTFRPVRRRHKPQGWPALAVWMSRAGGARRDGDPLTLILMKGDAVYKRFTRRTSNWPHVRTWFSVDSLGALYVSPAE